MVCIVCPIGCNLEVEISNNEVISVKGNACKRGEVYAKSECIHPTRVLTTTIKVENGIYPVVSVKSTAPLPKELLFECMNVINNISVKAPISIGDILIKNICETNIDIIATKNLPLSSGDLRSSVKK